MGIPPGKGTSPALITSVSDTRTETSYVPPADAVEAVVRTLPTVGTANVSVPRAAGQAECLA